jgi:hypothetical protein
MVSVSVVVGVTVMVAVIVPVAVAVAEIVCVGVAVRRVAVTVSVAVTVPVGVTDAVGVPLFWVEPVGVSLEAPIADVVDVAADAGSADATRNRNPMTAMSSPNAAAVKSLIERSPQNTTQL